MATYWRISNHRDLSGGGGRKVGGRWHSAGAPIVYMTDSVTSAILEALVHLDGDSGDIPDSYRLLRISIPDQVPVEKLNPLAGTKWQVDEKTTKRLGDHWLRTAKTAIARVPSAIAPHTWNYLLNPAHPDASKAKIASVIREQFDDRLFRFGAP